jgi:hypothetical protein
VSVFTKIAGLMRKSARLFSSRYRISASEHAFYRSVSDAVPPAPRGSPIVLVEAVEDYYYLALFACIVARIAGERPAQAQQFIPRSLRPGSTRSPIQAVKSLCFYNFLTDRKWMRLYSAFCGGVAYKSASPLISRNTATDLIEAWRIWRRLESKEMLLNLTVSGTKLGDLTYDSYLRFKPAATVDLKNAYLWIVIWQTLRDLRAARAYMLRAKPKMLLTTYSTYIQHGVAVRVALSLGIKVFSFGNFQQFYKQLHAMDWLHTRNPDHYRSGFAQLKNPESKIAEAERALSARLSGTNDAATAYMRRSAYAGTAELPKEVSGSLLLFLHDFFDGPHCYRWVIFPDFWEWATFTLDLARSAGIRILVKPHPNEISSSKMVVRKLMAAYPEATWLSADASNVQLAKAGVACAVTIHGTVAHEMAFLGVPSIAAGHNPHIDFMISNTAHDRDEYTRLILNYRNLARSPEKMRRESLEFYCMHNLNVTAEESSLRETTIKFRMRMINDDDGLRAGDDCKEFFEQLNSAPAFRKACGELAAHLADKGEQRYAAASGAGEIRKREPRVRVER